MSVITGTYFRRLRFPHFVLYSEAGVVLLHVLSQVLVNVTKTGEFLPKNNLQVNT